MKIWPLDYAAVESDGYYISGESLEKAIEPFAKIRNAVGNKMDIMVELHGLWRFPAALTIAKALEQFDPFWYEDPLRPDSMKAITDYAAKTQVPICLSETLGGRMDFRNLLETGAASIIMPDLVWCGGLTEGRKIASLADAYHRPVAPHDCTGPVAYMAAIHLSLSAPNVLVQESVRSFYTGWYQELVTQVPQPNNGHIFPPEGVGLGTELLPEVFQREDVSVVNS